MSEEKMEYKGFEDVTEDYEFDWDDEIENDGPEFILLPAGDYEFTVMDFERGRHPGSEKLPACNKAILHLKIDGGEKGSTTIKHNLFLHKRTEGMLCSFFTAIGQRKHGEKLKMNWNSVIGSHGTAKIEIHEWKNSSGETRQSNQVKRFYEPDEAKTTGPADNEPKVEQATFRPGEF